ncbi:hypothetical protein [Ruegeria atlantica]|uniref:hypothetical protein n=1 Tax=Ruegeria atlantica TaxID=81569 RepID=UPI00147BF1FD|nr:hypothetical protein [Ruegeria atlantica]
MIIKDILQSNDIKAPVSFGGGGGGGGGGSNRLRATRGALTSSAKVLNQISENHPGYSDVDIWNLSENNEAHSAGHPHGDSYSGYPGGDWDGR